MKSIHAALIAFTLMLSGPSNADELALTVLDASVVTGEDGSEHLRVQWDDESARRLSSFSATRVGKPVSFLIDDEVLVATTMMMPLRGNSMLVTLGNVDRQIEDIALSLQSGTSKLKIADPD